MGSDFEELNGILSFLASKYDASIIELKGRHRNKNIVELRDKYIYLARDYSNDNEDIGKVINRDRATIYGAREKINGLFKIYPEIKEEYESLKEDYKSWRGNTTKEIDNHPKTFTRFM